MSMKDNKRKRTRVDFNAKIVLKTDSLEITENADSRDISMKGIFINTDKKIPPGKRCDIRILLSGTTSNLSLGIQGTVIRQNTNGLGIAFDSMDPASYLHLKNIVMYNSSDPDAVEKEMFS